jgi:hypothetical protein
MTCPLLDVEIDPCVAVADERGPVVASEGKRCRSGAIASAGSGMPAAMDEGPASWLAARSGRDVSAFSCGPPADTPTIATTPRMITAAVNNHRRRESRFRRVHNLLLTSNGKTSPVDASRSSLTGR